MKTKTLFFLFLTLLFINTNTAFPKEWPDSVKTVRYPASSDQSKQPMLVYTTPAKEKRPLLVGLHTWSADYKQGGGEIAYLRWCIENNWHFIHPNFRGPNNTPDGCGSDKAVHDIIDAVNYMKKHHSIDNDRIYLIGVSGGGHAALLMAGRFPEVWAGVSAWVPISDLGAWWKQCSNNKFKKYANHIEKAIGGQPDSSDRTKTEIKNRSPITFLSHAKTVNLDINAGVYDGRSGSVPFKQSLYAFNAVANEKDKLKNSFIEQFYKTQSLPKGVKQTNPDPLYGEKVPIFRKTSGNARVTIFKGGHQIIHQAALNWLNQQHKGISAQWNIVTKKELQTKSGEEESGK